MLIDNSWSVSPMHFYVSSLEEEIHRMTLLFKWGLYGLKVVCLVVA